MTTESLLLAWGVGSIVVAIISEQRDYGFFQGLIMGVVFTPILGIVGVMLHTQDYEAKKATEERKRQLQNEPIKPDGYAMKGEKIPHVGSRYSFGITDELYKLSILKDRGVITQAEFEKQKSKLFNA